MKKFVLNALMALIDITVLITLFYVTLYIRSNINETVVPVFSTIDIQSFSFVIFIILILLHYEKIYTLRYDFWQETFRIIKVLTLSYIIVLALLALTKLSFHYSRLFISLYFLLVVFILPIIKRLTKYILFQLAFFKKQILLVGNIKQVNIFKNEFKKNWYLGLEYNENDYDSVIIASDGMELETINSKINNYLDRNSSVYVIPYVTSINFANANIMEYSNIRYNTIQIENRLLLQKNILIKNIVDFVLILLILPLFFVVHLFVSLLIKIDSKGTIFFKQYRLGKNNQNFLCYKYRTMYDESDKILEKYLKDNPDEVNYYEEYHKYKNDPRITKIGKLLRSTSLDELPQIINILKSNMSFIGPRPYMLQESCKLGDDKRFILKVKPGITGLWQVSGRNNLTFKERNELEVWYIKNWSLWSDLVILIKTIKVVLLKIGAK